MQIELKTNYWPRLSAWHVRRALKSINPTDLEGLGYVQLMDEEPDDPAALKKPAYLRGFLYNGRYRKKSVDGPAHVVLYTRDLYLGIPLVLKPSPMATLIIASTIAHEVGHHVIASRGYIYKPHEKYKPWRSGAFDPYEEKMANSYASDVIKRMCQSWYYKFGKFLARTVSYFLFQRGIGEHTNGNYDRAAYYNFQAFMINGENIEAGQSYRHDMEKLESEKPRDSATNVQKTSDVCRP